MFVSHFVVSAVATALVLAARGRAQQFSDASLHALLASDAVYERTCPSDAGHMNGCFHFNVTAARRTDPQLVSELTYDLRDTLLVDPHYVSQTMALNAGCAVLNQIHSHLAMVGKAQCRNNVVYVYGHRLSISASREQSGCLQVELVPPATAAVGHAVVAVSEAKWDRTASASSPGRVYYVCGPEELPQVTLNISL